MKLLLDCRCGAKYDPVIRWLYGYYGPGTSTQFLAEGQVRAGHCPVCLRPPINIMPAPPTYHQRTM